MQARGNVEVADTSKLCELPAPSEKPQGIALSAHRLSWR